MSVVEEEPGRTVQAGGPGDYRTGLALDARQPQSGGEIFGSMLGRDTARYTEACNRVPVLPLVRLLVPHRLSKLDRICL